MNDDQVMNDLIRGCGDDQDDDDEPPNRRVAVPNGPRGTPPAAPAMNDLIRAYATSQH